MKPLQPMRSAGLRLLIALLAGPLALPVPALAADAWPAEPHTAAVSLTGADPEFDASNMSGASWNPVTRTLWLANNSGRFHALVENGAGGFRVATNAAGVKARWAPGGDLESICQADYGLAIVYLLDENGWIREYDVSQHGVIFQNRAWDIRAQCPEVSGAYGPEGLTFVPDEWLRRQRFRAPDGQPRVSTNGMGGLMFVGIQDGGFVHVFDLNRANGSFAHLGRFKTGRSETAGLDFDRGTGTLFIWHNLGPNYLEVTSLDSYPDGGDRRLQPLAEYAGPRDGNLEGFAVAAGDGTNEWCFVADDNNDYGQAIAWYRQFHPSRDIDADSLPDGWELWHFGSITQTTGVADSDADTLCNRDEYLAGTEPTNRLSVLALTNISAAASSNRVVIEWHSISGRTYAAHSVAGLAPGDTQHTQAPLPATPPLNVATCPAPGAGGFYRISAGTAP